MVLIRTPTCAKQLRLRECRKNLARQQLVAQSGVETFNDSVLPRRAWLDVQRIGSALFALFFHHIRDELASIVAANISILRLFLRFYSAFKPYARQTWRSGL